LRGAERGPEASPKKPPIYRKVHRAVSRSGIQHPDSCKEAETTPEFRTKKEADKDAEGEKEARVHVRIRSSLFDSKIFPPEVGVIS
jgi:hypothetical protein